MHIHVTAAFLVIRVAACSDLCGNEEFVRVHQPSGDFDAVAFQRDCGATTGFSIQVSLIPAGDSLPNESGNVLIIEDHPKDTDLRLTCDADTLVIIGADRTGAYKSENKVRGVHIRYEQ
jgi:hypothetical protein